MSFRHENNLIEGGESAALHPKQPEEVSTKYTASIGSRSHSASSYDRKYRHDIDGLRALAVLFVVFYHAFPNVLRGGYIGVDIFFVISGFLISSILFLEMSNGCFSISVFYGKRIRRIFPALALCLAFVLVYGFVSLMPSELAQLGKHVFFGASFLSNIALWSESGYFDQVATLKPLLHLWSLGIEEQFYIVWPVLLWISFKIKARIGFLLSALFVISFSVNILLSITNISDDFYLPLSRFWELLAGAAIAWQGPITLTPKVRTWLSWLGLATLLAAAALFTPEMRFPGWLALVPIAGAVAVILAGPEAAANRMILSNRAAVSIGLISYPLYIWHWPLISYAYVIRLGKAPTLIMSAGLVAASFVLAWATYQFVERPVRFGANRRHYTWIVAGCIGLLGACGLVVWTENGFPQRFPPLPGIDIQKISIASVDDIFKPTNGMEVVEHDNTLVTHIGSGNQKVAFSGDSVLFHYGPRVQQLADEGKLLTNVYFVVGASCAPAPGVIQRDQFVHCADMPGLLADLVRREKIQTVVLGAFWAGYRGLSIEREGRRLPIATGEGQDAFYSNLEDYIHELQDLGARIYLVLSVPGGPRFDPRGMVTRSLTSVHIAPDAQKGETVTALRADRAQVDSRLRIVAERTGAALLDPFPDVCGLGEICSAFFGAGEPKFTDSLHLRPVFVREHLHFLDPLLANGP